MRTRSTPALPFLRFALLLLLSALGESEWVPLDELASQLSERWPAWDRISFADQPEVSSGGPRRTGPTPPAPGAGPRLRLCHAGYPCLETVLARRGLSARPGARGRGRWQRTARRTADRSGTLCPGHGADTSAASDLRAVHFRAAQLRGDRLSPGIDAPVSGAAEPVRLVVADRGGTRAKAHSRVDRSRAGLGADGRDDPRNLDEAQPEAAAAWRHRRRQELGQSPRARDLLRRRHVDRVWLVGRARRGPGLLARRANWPRRLRSPSGFCWSKTTNPLPSTVFAWPALATIAGRRRFALSSSPTACRLSLDPGRSDLLVEAEIARFADLLPSAHPERDHRAAPERRQFHGHAGFATARNGPGNLRGPARRVVQPTYRRRGPSRGTALAHGEGIAHSHPEGSPHAGAQLPNRELLDGLLQHPATSPLLGQRLGPSSAVIADDRLPSLQKALKDLGIELRG